MKQTEVQIMGTSYVLNFPEENEPELLSAVLLVDSAMCKIRENGKTKARERVAVLAALNIAADMLKKLESSQIPVPDAHSTPALTTPSSEAVAQLIAEIDQTLAKPIAPTELSKQATSKHC